MLRRLTPWSAFATGSLIALVLAATAGGADITGAAAQPDAEAFAVKVVVPGQPDVVGGAVSAPSDSAAADGSFAYPADGSIVSATTISTNASTTSGETTQTTASSDVTSLSLFGGEITADAVAARAIAEATPTSASGGFDGSGLTNLAALGTPVQPAPGLRIALADWGYALLMQQGLVPGPPDVESYRGFITMLDVHLVADHGGLPAGSEILVGYADASAQAVPAVEESTDTTGVPLPTLPPAPPETTTSPPPASKQKARDVRPAKPTVQRAPRPKVKRLSLPKQGSDAQPRIVHLPPPLITPKLTAGGYVFPVYGPSSYSDSFGAPRADVTYHHGDDIFAPLGAPILAVSDGTVFSVGWNKIGGNRLWLRDREGNEFYYAHLSAYSTLAVNGAHVKAGDVVGFVGNTGDAQGTPYHLHFEVHPVSLLGLGYDGAVDPTSYLDGWRHAVDVRFTPVAGWVPSAGLGSPAPKPGAILLQSTDISTADGLDPGALRRAFVRPMYYAAETAAPPTSGSAQEGSFVGVDR